MSKSSVNASPMSEKREGPGAKDLKHGFVNDSTRRASHIVASWSGMSDRSNTRIVYSTAAGRVCPGCGWPERDCKCSKRIGPDEALPARLVAKLRMEKKGRGGKTVTVVYGLPRHAAFLQQLTHDLKRACGTGGTTLEDGIELQGDLRDRVRDLLRKQGFVVKG